MAQLARVCSRASASRLVGTSRCFVHRFECLYIAFQWPCSSCKTYICCSSDHGSCRANCRAVCHAAPGVAADEASDSHQLPEDDWLQRSRLLVGADGLAKLAAVNVLLVGLGGVGSFAAEFLCRAGVGRMTIVDGDTIDTTNRNRQLPALKSTVGLLKAEVVADRLKDINPELQLTVKQEFLDPIRAAALVQEQQYHYVVDCIDSVAPKQALLLAGHQAGCKVVSSMGAGGRLDPSRVQLADISETYNDAFASVVRRGLRKAGVSSGVTVVFSDELAKPASLALTQQQYKKSYFGTSSYIPAIFGLYIASHIIRDVVDGGYKIPAKAAAAGRAAKNNSRGAKQNSSNGKSSKVRSSRLHKQQQQRFVDNISASDSRRDEAQQMQQQQQNAAPYTNAAAGSPDAADLQQKRTADTCFQGPNSATMVQVLHAKQQQLSSEADCQPGLANAASIAQQEGVEGQVQDLGLVLRSFEQSKGVGAGFDGDGI